MAKIKLTDANNNVSYPSDLQGLSYDEAVEQLNVLEQVAPNDNFEPDRQLEDVLVRNFADGTCETFEIEN